MDKSTGKNETLPKRMAASPRKTFRPHQRPTRDRGSLQTNKGCIQLYGRGDINDDGGTCRARRGIDVKYIGQLILIKHFLITKNNINFLIKRCKFETKILPTIIFRFFKNYQNYNELHGDS